VNKTLFNLTGMQQGCEYIWFCANSIHFNSFGKTALVKNTKRARNVKANNNSNCDEEEENNNDNN
jgi:hypothetical protein